MQNDFGNRSFHPPPTNSLPTNMTGRQWVAGGVQAAVNTMAKDWESEFEPGVRELY